IANQIPTEGQPQDGPNDWIEYSSHAAWTGRRGGRIRRATSASGTSGSNGSSQRGPFLGVERTFASRASESGIDPKPTSAPWHGRASRSHSRYLSVTTGNA